VELVGLRVMAQGIPDRPRVPERVRLDRPDARTERVRRVYFGPGHGWLDTPILSRADLEGGRPGPCIVEEYDATCVVPPGAHAALDVFGNIAIDLPAPGGPGR